MALALRVVRERPPGAAPLAGRPRQRSPPGPGGMAARSSHSRPRSPRRAEPGPRMWPARAGCPGPAPAPAPEAGRGDRGSSRFARPARQITAGGRAAPPRLFPGRSCWHGRSCERIPASPREGLPLPHGCVPEGRPGGGGEQSAILAWAASAGPAVTCEWPGEQQPGPFFRCSDGGRRAVSRRAEGEQLSCGRQPVPPQERGRVRLVTPSVASLGLS